MTFSDYFSPLVNFSRALSLVSAVTKKMGTFQSLSTDPVFAKLIGMIGKAMSRSLTDRIREAGFDLNMEDWIVLAHLWQKDGQNQASLGEIAGRHKTAVTRGIDHLEELNYVLRVPDQTDRRNKLIYLTNAGKALEESLRPIAEEMHKEALKGIPQSDLDRLHSTLRRVLVNVRHHI